MAISTMSIGRLNEKVSTSSGSSALRACTEARSARILKSLSERFFAPNSSRASVEPIIA